MRASDDSGLTPSKGEVSASALRRTVLVVDDEEDIVLSLKHLIESTLTDAQVVPAASGRAALEILGRRRIDCIVTDFRMPGMDGVQFLAQAFRLRPEAPAIMVTAFEDAEKVLHAALGGARVPVLRKPLDVPLFMDRLEEMLAVPVH